MGDFFIYFFITLPHGQLHNVFRGFTSIFGGWMLLCQELIMAERQSPYNYTACNTILM